MNKIQLGIDAISTTPIRIGFEGENVHTQVTFFWTVLRSKYPDAVASLSIKPPVGDIYPKSVTQDGNKVVWDVTASDTANPGSGEYQLTFTDGEEIIKTYIGNFTVNDSIIGDGEAPDPIQDWVADANAVLGELSEISASVTTLEAGESATVEVTEVGGHKNLAFGIPAGEKGDQGEQGDPAPAEEVIPAVNAYLAEVITNPDSPPLDRTLSSSSAAAPADMVGDLKSAINLLEVTNDYPGLTIQTNKYVHSGTGEIASNTSKSPRAITGIPVEGDAAVVKIPSCEVAGVRGLAFYDSLGTFVPNSGVGYTVGQLIYVVPVPATAKTMGITSFGDNMFSVQFLHYQTTDKTLTKQDVPADGKATGDAIDNVLTIAEKSYSLIQSVLNITENTYTDTPDRGVSAANAGFILSDASDKCSIKFTPLFSSTTNPYTNVASGSFTVRMYNITRAEDDTVTLGEQIGSDVSYSIGDEIDIPYFDGTMLLDIRDAKDSNNNTINVAYLRSGKSWGNSLVSFANNTTSVTNWGVYGIGGTAVVTHTKVQETQQIKSILNGKKITVIGDSITHHNYRAKTNWAMWIADWTDATIQNLGVSGSGFTRGDPTIYIDRIPSIDSDVDIIGIAISWNDIGSNHPPIGDVTDTGTSTICGYINDFFDTLMEDFPTTPVIAYIQCPWVNRHPGIEDSDSYFEKVVELLKLKGIPFYYDLYYGGTLKPWIEANSEYYFKMDDESSSHYPLPADGVHPNSEGHKVIARYLYPKFAENIVDVGMNYHLE